MQMAGSMPKASLESHELGNPDQESRVLLVAEQANNAECSSTVAPMTERNVLAVGAKAPAFALADQRGEKVRLSSFKGRKVLVYFYPKADTPGCTTQACGLRDIADEIGDTVVLGMSPDQPEKLAKFDDKYGLGFTLLSDPEHTTLEAYGAWGDRSLYGRKFMGVVRSAVLVDEKGVVTHVWPKISPKDTPTNLLKALAG